MAGPGATAPQGCLAPSRLISRPSRGGRPTPLGSRPLVIGGSSALSLSRRLRPPGRPVSPPRGRSTRLARPELQPPPGPSAPRLRAGLPGLAEHRPSPDPRRYVTRSWAFSPPTRLGLCKRCARRGLRPRANGGAQSRPRQPIARLGAGSRHVAHGGRGAGCSLHAAGLGTARCRAVHGGASGRGGSCEYSAGAGRSPRVRPPFWAPGNLGLLNLALEVPHSQVQFGAPVAGGSRGWAGLRMREPGGGRGCHSPASAAYRPCHWTPVPSVTSPRPARVPRLPP